MRKQPVDHRRLLDALGLIRALHYEALAAFEPQLEALALAKVGAPHRHDDHRVGLRPCVVAREAARVYAHGAILFLRSMPALAQQVTLILLLPLVAVVGVLEHPAPRVGLLLVIELLLRLPLVHVHLYHRPVQAPLALPVLLAPAKVTHLHAADGALTVRWAPAHFAHQHQLRVGIHVAKATVELVQQNVLAALHLS